MAAATTGLSYLTVQDMLWTHLQITKQPHDFRFADLEEATYYQYGYGKSVDLFGQAARFLQGFAKKAPFGKADAAAGFIGFVAFLAINGYDLNLPDAEAAAWVGRVRGGDLSAKEAIEKLAVHSHEHAPEVADALTAALEKYAGTVRALA